MDQARLSPVSRDRAVADLRADHVVAEVGAASCLQTRRNNPVFRATAKRISSALHAGCRGSIRMSFFEASTWVIPVIVAITFHEAAHGFVALLCGDQTAWRLGRVSFNPLKHIDPFGTLLLPGLLLLLRSPFLFGYAKPVPVNFRALRHPRRDMILVAAAGPGMNLALAMLAALALHMIVDLPDPSRQWAQLSLRNAIFINVLLAVFNMLPIPPLDGGRVAVGLLPKFLGLPLAALEPFGLLILIVLLFFVPMLGAQLGVDLGIISRLVGTATNRLIEAILAVTGSSWPQG